ncbi:MAG: hypothetical protein OET79_11935 [Nitrospirota bacterium]|nr:hypothetical protein [Nitrospirota bacterium]
MRRFPYLGMAPRAGAMGCPFCRATRQESLYHDRRCQSVTIEVHRDLAPRRGRGRTQAMALFDRIRKGWQRYRPHARVNMLACASHRH